MHSLINFQERVRVGIVQFNAVRHHPRLDKFIVALADVTELVQVIKELHIESGSDGARQLAPTTDREVVVRFRRLCAEARNGDSD